MYVRTYERMEVDAEGRCKKKGRWKIVQIMSTSNSLLILYSILYFTINDAITHYESNRVY